MGFKTEEGSRPGTEADVTVILPLEYAELCTFQKEKLKTDFLKMS